MGVAAVVAVGRRVGLAGTGVTVAVGGLEVGVETATVGAGVAVSAGVSTTSATSCSTSAGGGALLQAAKSQLKKIR